MRYPCLVPKQLCRTDIQVNLHSGGLSESGSPMLEATLELKGNYQDTGRTVLTADKQLIQLSGIALFPGDICPDLPAIAGGTATVYGVERTIFRATKARNPDGTVNHTKLEMM